MTFVPIGFCVLAFLALLLIKRRNTEYTLIVREDDSTKAINNHRPNGYGAVENHTATLQAPVVDYDSDTDQEEETTQPHSINYNNEDSHSNHNSLRVKPCFVVGSTPTPDSPGTIPTARI